MEQSDKISLASRKRSRSSASLTGSLVCACAKAEVTKARLAFTEQKAKARMERVAEQQKEKADREAEYQNVKAAKNAVYHNRSACYTLRGSSGRS